MLIEKTAPGIGDIVSFKLVNGDEIVGKLKSKSNTGYGITKPVIIAMQMVGPSQAQLAFAPFMASTSDDQSFFFGENMLLTSPVLTRKDVSANYIRATSSIEVPSAATTAGLIL